jgi:hypothetical protein
MGGRAAPGAVVIVLTFNRGHSVPFHFRKVSKMKVPSYVFSTILKPGRNRSHRRRSWPRRIIIIVLRAALAIAEGTL